MKVKLIELMGWYGTVAIIGAYILVSFNMLNSTSITFQLLNLSGSMGLVALSYNKKVYQGAVLNVVWSGIAVAALVKIIFF